MTKGRGLNKGRGLGSLIPPKTKNNDSGNVPEEKENSRTADSVGDTSVAEESEATQNKKVNKTGSKAVNKAGNKAGKTEGASKKKTKSPGKSEQTGKTDEKKTEEAKTAASEKEKPESPEIAAQELMADKTVEKRDLSGKSADHTDPFAKANDTEHMEEVISVRLTEVVPNREQPRKRFDETAIEELAASIREHGIVTPLLVQKKGKYYELIAGERRWRAAKLAGLKKVPVLLRDFSEEQAAEIALIENIQRENLNAMEEAMAFRRLQEEFSLKQEDIAKRVSRSRSAITNSLRLLKLEEHVQTMLAEGRLSMGHARALLSLENPEMQKITAEQVAENDLSVRETEKLVRQLLAPKKPAKSHVENEQLRTIYHDLEEQLRKSIGTRVSIQPIKGKKGKIEIEYYSDEDLERIIAQLRQS